MYPPPADAPADIPGLEFAGEVDALGPGASRFHLGERVMGLVGGGAYAEKLVIAERAALPMGAKMDFVSAAAIPEAFVTAFDALVLQAGLEAGDQLLIHAVGSGVGTAAVQIGKLLGARVLGTSRSLEKLGRCKTLGLDVGLHLTEPRFAEEVKRLTEGRGADVILDLVGGDYLEENVSAMAVGGRQMVVGLLAGLTGTLPLATLLNRRLTIRGTVLRSRPLVEKIALMAAFEGQMLGNLDDGKLAPVVEAALPASQVQEAHRRLEANATFGKIVLTW
jgi:NADPH:quinone reductase-like Zn-dependent oxidoreductase